jgi:hypothetical protein
MDRLLVLVTGWGVRPEPYGIIGLKMGIPGVMAPLGDTRKHSIVSDAFGYGSNFGHLFCFKIP